MGAVRSIAVNLNEMVDLCSMQVTHFVQGIDGLTEKNMIHLLLLYVLQSNEVMGVSALVEKSSLHLSRK